jgi:hypothetical protein
VATLFVSLDGAICEVVSEVTIFVGHRRARFEARTDTPLTVAYSFNVWPVRNAVMR